MSSGGAGNDDYVGGLVGYLLHVPSGLATLLVMSMAVVELDDYVGRLIGRDTLSITVTASYGFGTTNEGERCWQ